MIIGGGLGVRLGEPYAKRIAKAMQPHLFDDERPPHVHVARRSAISAGRSGRRCCAPSGALKRPIGVELRLGA